MKALLQQALEARKALNSGSFTELCSTVTAFITAVEQHIAQAAKPLSEEQIRKVGGIVHRDGNIFFTSIAHLNAAIKEQQP